VIAAVAQHPPPDAGPALARSVEVSDTTVTPRALVVAPGTAVAWFNTGRDLHTVTEDSGLFASGTLAPGGRFRLRAPAAPGTYAYHCEFHAFIRGTLTVSLVSLEAPHPVVFGGRPAIAGTVPDVAAGTVVRVERRLPGAWEEVGAALTDDAGAFRLTGPPLTTRTALRAMAGESISPSVRAEVRPAVTVARRGARLVVRVRPAPRGGSAHLERLDLDTYRWEPVASRRLSAGRTRFHLGAPGVYRAMVGARAGLSAAESRVVEFKPGAFRE
jgi:plastocyanin